MKHDNKVPLKERIMDLCFKWLPIIMCCHCLPERSFFVKGRQMPVCARCEGQLIGMLAALIGIFIGRLKIEYLILMLIPLIIDGTVQALTSYESNNYRRLITGALFGYALTSLVLISLIALFMWGYNKGASLQFMIH